MLGEPVRSSPLGRPAVALSERQSLTADFHAAAGLALFVAVALLPARRPGRRGNPVPACRGTHGPREADRGPDGAQECPPQLLNAEIIRQGYGFAYTKYPFARIEEFRQVEPEARRARRGLWAQGP